MRKNYLVLIVVILIFTTSSCGKRVDVSEEVEKILLAESTTSIQGSEIIISTNYGIFGSSFDEVVEFCKAQGFEQIKITVSGKNGLGYYSCKDDEEKYLIEVDGLLYDSYKMDFIRICEGNHAFLISKEAGDILYSNGLTDIHFYEEYTYTPEGELTVYLDKDTFWRMAPNSYEIAYQLFNADASIIKISFSQNNSTNAYTYIREEQKNDFAENEDITGTKNDEANIQNSKEENNSEYYVNAQGDLVDKVEEFSTQTINGYTIQYPILEDGVDEVVVYEFDTYDNHHVVVDASNVYQQVQLNQLGDYGDVQLEVVAPGRDIAYMSDGECYYIEDYSRNLLTITTPQK